MMGPWGENGFVRNDKKRNANLLMIFEWKLKVQ